MRKTRKIIITCAPTGSIHTPSMSPHLPVTPAAIARSAIEAAQEGAAILHLHARSPEDGRPSPRAADFMAFLPQIGEATDAVINISTGGSATMSLDERLEGAKAARPELCSLNMGPLIFDFSAAGGRVGKWLHDWERIYVESSDDRIMYNSNTYIERIMREVGQEFGTRFEFECYDIGHLYTLAHFAERKLVQPPFLIQGVFGILGGIGADPRNLAHMVTIADSLFGGDYVFSAFAAGRHQMQFCTQSALLGGNVRVGLEDSLYIGPGQLARSNADQVRRIRGILAELSLEVATPAEARSMLALKGPASVGF
ncbi:MAG TPA: 3-keto-5-aminohexanoate cleavage protein [Steroidobacteraceae bacterium]|nr:3-keto-5-aminohexanoate cleavage protein [Steroidobacteraceae bacterium]